MDGVAVHVIARVGVPDGAGGAGLITASERAVTDRRAGVPEVDVESTAQVRVAMHAASMDY